MRGVLVTADRCPGVLRLHEAADGALARVRLPGGLITATQLRTLVASATEWGDGRLELTSRGNVQVRGLHPSVAEPLETRLTDAGLLPSHTHERVRNVLASPLAGVDDGIDPAPFVRELDRQLCAAPRLAELSGRFLFGFDDGRGDIADLEPDVLAVLGAGDEPVAVGSAMVAAASDFLAERARTGSDAWRVRDLGLAGPVVVAGALPGSPPPHPVGLVPRTDGDSALVVLAPLGRLTGAQASWLADAAGDDELRVTPWRSMVLPHGGPAEAEQAERLGFGVSANSGWLHVSACAGRPRCASALADVQSDAAAARDRWPGRVVHWSGCERRCGRPHDTEVDVLATPDGYAISGSADA